MRIDYHKFINGGQSESQKYINFFNSFGYLQITNAFDRSLVLKSRREYKRIYEEKTKKSWKELMKSGVQFFIPNFYEESEFFLNDILIKKIHPIANMFAQNKAIYLGSDGSCFNGQSFQWHRDWFTKSRMLKFNVYMNSGLHFGGRHILIPGTQFTSDEFSQSVGRGGAWPFKPKKFGWLNENEFFPDTPAPRDHFLRRVKRKFFKKNYLPYVAIKPRPTDIVLFDLRAWHMVEKPFPSIPQMLATGLFAVHPEVNSIKNLNGSQEKSKDEIYNDLNELAGLYVGERKMIGCDNYGKFFEKLNKKGFLHFKANQNICDIENYSKLKVELSDGSFSRTMKPIMDDYINQGKIARASNEDIGDGYIEEMLGINYSNIASYHKSFEKPGRPKNRENFF